VPHLDQLRGLLDVARAGRSGGDLQSVLDAMASTMARALGYGTSVINLRRPAWDDFEVAVVHGSADARDALLGTRRGWAEWEPLLQARWESAGAYFIPAGEFDWGADPGRSWAPSRGLTYRPDAWHPDDVLLVPMHDGTGQIMGIVSVDEPVDGQRPDQADLEVLSALTAHASLAVQHALATADGLRHRAAVEHLLSVSAQLNGRGSTEEILAAVCAGVRDALGFEKVMLLLAEGAEEVMTPRGAVGWTDAQLESLPRIPLKDMRTLIDPAFEREGCVLMEREEAHSRTPPVMHSVYASARNGRGPQAWHNQWLMVPLYDRDGALTGHLWADDPSDRLLPTRERLVALRTFANQAMSALESARQLEATRHLAEHDPLTGLRNRRNFDAAIDAHLDRAEDERVPLSLLICDLDHFKQINDSLGHVAGDAVLRRLAGVLRRESVAADVPTRLGGEEFALVLPGLDTSGAVAFAERLRLAVRAEFEGFAAQVSVSAGVATTSADLRSPGALTRGAFRALWAAKRLGRDRCVAYHARTLETLHALQRGDARSGEQLAAAVLLAETLDLRDGGTARHSDSVGRYAEQIARALGFSAAGVERVRVAGVLHDIGKLGIADAILQKPGPLDDAEWQEMRRHPELGARILEHANLHDIAVWVRAHHERVDGRGYPAGLSGEEIPLEARILAVADSYEAMTADRPYRAALTPEDAREELRRHAGAQFDGRVVEAFVRVLQSQPSWGPATAARRDAISVTAAPT
jgi:diguanylate cyclase (GGDEF)-like protein/putative nucleotidyltransferase with HDIG domain